MIRNKNCSCLSDTAVRKWGNVAPVYRFPYVPLLFSALVAICLMAVPGCVPVPIRVPTQTRDASGKLQQLDFTFLKSGLTTRDEVTKNLAAINTGVHESNFFWGRWDISKWRTTMVGYVPPDSKRIWREHNLLIQFDPNGVVKTWVVVGDKNLDHQLDVLDPAAADPPLDLSAPLRLNARIPQVEIQESLVLSSDSIEKTTFLTRLNSRLVKTPRTNVLRIAPTPGALDIGEIFDRTSRAAPNLLVVTVYLAKPATVIDEKNHSVGKRKKLVLGLDPPTFLLLRRYIGQTQRGAASIGPADRVTTPTNKP